jgi:hypothetical protein
MIEAWYTNDTVYGPAVLQCAPGPRSLSSVVISGRRAFVTVTRTVAVAANSARRLRKKVLLSLRHHISLVLLELSITGMCLLTHGPFLRISN